MHTAPLLMQRAVVAGVALLCGGVYLGLTRSCGVESRAARIVVGIGALVTAPAVWFSLLQPVIGYAFVCLLMVLAFAVDLAVEERTRSRRSAPLQPRARAELVPAFWSLVATASAAMIVPYAIAATERAAAVTVGICALLMAGIAWRIACAPTHLTGSDPQRERIAERASRALRSGVTAALAVAIVFVFSSFENQVAAIVTPAQHFVNAISFIAWIVLWLWAMLYAWSLKRTLRAA